MDIYNIELLSKKELIEHIYLEIEKESDIHIARLFLERAKKDEYKMDVLKTAETFIAIQLKDSVENCLYCEDELKTEGIYCDDTCKNLNSEERV